MCGHGRFAPPVLYRRNPTNQRAVQIPRSLLLCRDFFFSLNILLTGGVLSPSLLVNRTERPADRDALTTRRVVLVFQRLYFYFTSAFIFFLFFREACTKARTAPKATRARAQHARFERQPSSTRPSLRAQRGTSRARTTRTRVPPETFETTRIPGARWIGPEHERERTLKQGFLRPFSEAFAVRQRRLSITTLTQDTTPCSKGERKRPHCLFSTKAGAL